MTHHSIMSIAMRNRNGESNHAPNGINGHHPLGSSIMNQESNHIVNGIDPMTGKSTTDMSCEDGTCPLSGLASNDINTDVNLRHEFRHLFRLMGVFGLYHTPKRWQESNNGPRYKRFLHCAHRAYCILILALLILNGIKSAVGIWHVDGHFRTLQMVFSAYLFQCSANSSIWFCICYTDRLPIMFDFWQRHCQSSRESRVFGTAVDSTCIRRVWIIVILSVSLVVFPTSIIIGTRLGPSELVRNDTQFFIEPTIESIPEILFEVNLIISGTYGNAAFWLPTSFLLIMCMTLTHQFNRLTDFFTKCISDTGKFKLCLMSLRRQHQYISKVVYLLDEAFCFYLAVTFGACIILACFLMYNLVIANVFASIFSTLMIAFWLCNASLQFTLNGLMTACVHDRAHDIANHIHDISVFGFQTHEEVTQMNMFMAKLNGQPIAFTLWNILPITKEFLLTVVGVYITYFALVAQSF